MFHLEGSFLITCNYSGKSALPQATFYQSTVHYDNNRPIPKELKGNTILLDTTHIFIDVDSEKEISVTAGYENRIKDKFDLIEESYLQTLEKLNTNMDSANLERYISTVPRYMLLRSHDKRIVEWSLDLRQIDQILEKYVE